MKTEAEYLLNEQDNSKDLTSIKERLGKISDQLLGVVADLRKIKGGYDNSTLKNLSGVISQVDDANNQIG